ncbi:MAG: DUF4381 family protein [Gemmatimonadetes bacterium]|nr:DUF4381 family protein [Gemmatimonadota bacterium]
MIGRILTALVAGLGVLPAQAQAPPADTSRTLTVSTGVAPETVTVGDRFRSYVRVRVPPRARVELGTFAPNDSLQLADSVQSVAAGSAAVYPLVAWVAGEPLRQIVRVTVTLESGERRGYQVPLRLPVVRSVLPADAAELRPRPPKGLLIATTGDRNGWWLLLLLPAAVAAALLVRRLLQRKRPSSPGDPRAAALATLDRLGRTADELEAEPFYTAVTRVLRDYLARVDGRLGEDLTTAELLERLGQPGALGVDRATLAALLQHADPVKFGSVDPPAAEVRRFWSDARAWISVNPSGPANQREAA